MCMAGGFRFGCVHAKHELDFYQRSIKEDGERQSLHAVSAFLQDGMVNVVITNVKC